MEILIRVSKFAAKVISIFRLLGFRKLSGGWRRVHKVKRKINFIMLNLRFSGLTGYLYRDLYKVK